MYYLQFLGPLFIFAGIESTPANRHRQRRSDSLLCAGVRVLRNPLGPLDVLQRAKAWGRDVDIGESTCAASIFPAGSGAINNYCVSKAPMIWILSHMGATRQQRISPSTSQFRRRRLRKSPSPSQFRRGRLRKSPPPRQQRSIQTCRGLVFRVKAVYQGFARRARRRQWRRRSRLCTLPSRRGWHAEAGGGDDFRRCAVDLRGHT